MYLLMISLLAFGSYLCSAEDYFAHDRRYQGGRHTEHASYEFQEDGALALWFEEKYVWIADQFWSNVVQVGLLAHMSLALLLYLRRRYRLAHERRWNKVHTS